MSEFACRLHCKSSVAALAPVPLYIMDFALYELNLQINRLEFLLALVAPFSRGYVPAFVGEYVPFFSPRGF